MIVLKILLGIIAFIVILLHFSLVVYVKGGTNEELVYKVTFLGFTLYPRPPKEPKKPKKPRKPKDSEPDKPEEKPPEPDKPEELSSQPETVGTTELTEPEDTSEDKPGEGSEDKPGDDKGGDKDSGKKDEPGDDPKKEKKKKSKKEDSAEPEEKGSRLSELKEKYLFIKPFIPLGWKYFRKLLKAVRLTDVRVNIVTGKEDAYESAMFYGKLQMALMNVLTLLGGIFTVSVKEANVECVFNEKRLDAGGEVKVRVRPSTMIAIAFCMAFKALVIFLRQRHRKKRERKKAQKLAEQRKDKKTEPADTAA